MEDAFGAPPQQICARVVLVIVLGNVDSQAIPMKQYRGRGATGYGQRLSSLRTSSPADCIKPSSGMRARCSVHAGHGARTRLFWIDSCTGTSRGREIGAVRRLRAASSTSSCCFADVPWQRADELCGPARRSDDRKRGWYLARRSAPGLPSVLATIEKAREGGSSGLAGANLPRKPRRDYDRRPTDKLHSVHGRPRRDQDSSAHALLDHQAGSDFSGSARKRDAHDSLGGVGHLAAEFTPRGPRIFRICSPREPVCPGAGYGGSRAAHSPKEVKVTRLSRETSQPCYRSDNRPISLAKGVAKTLLFGLIYKIRPYQSQSRVLANQPHLGR